MEFFLARFFEDAQRLLELTVLLRCQLGKDVYCSLLLHGLTEDLFTLVGQCDTGEVLALHILGLLN